MQTRPTTVPRGAVTRQQQDTFTLDNGTSVMDGINCGAIAYAITHIYMTEGRLPTARGGGRGGDLRLSTHADTMKLRWHMIWQLRRSQCS